MTKSMECFVAGLIVMGYEPVILTDKPDHVQFDYEVQSGRFAGRKLRLGIVVPPDFPATWPTGPHVSPPIHALCSQGVHPIGAVHASNFGSDWQYWSRPLLNTTPGTQPVACYMSHVWRLWDSQ